MGKQYSFNAWMYKLCNLSYITNKSKQIIENIRKLREDGLNIYFTMDAEI